MAPNVNSRGGKQWHLVLENVSLGTAEAVTASLFPTGTEATAWEAVDVDVPLDFLASGANARYPLILHMGSPSRSNVRPVTGG